MDDLEEARNIIKTEKGLKRGEVWERTPFPLEDRRPAR
jgi:hypothetical protein